MRSLHKYMRRGADRNSDKVSRLAQLGMFKEPEVRAAVKKKLLDDFAKEDAAMREGRLGQLMADRLANESRRAIIQLNVPTQYSRAAASQSRIHRTPIPARMKPTPDILAPIPLNVERRLSPAIKTVNATNNLVPLVVEAPTKKAPRATGKCKNEYCNDNGTFDRSKVSKRASEIRKESGKNWSDSLKDAWREARH